jgi:hypothetical protein
MVGSTFHISQFAQPNGLQGLFILQYIVVLVTRHIPIPLCCCGLHFSDRNKCQLQLAKKTKILSRPISIFPNASTLGWSVGMIAPSQIKQINEKRSNWGTMGALSNGCHGQSVIFQEPGWRSLVRNFNSARKTIGSPSQPIVVCLNRLRG